MSMKDSPFWPFGPSHPDGVPYVMAMCSCSYCMEQRLDREGQRADCVAVWDFDGFKRELQKQAPYVTALPAVGPSGAFMGLRVIVDDTLAPGTAELRNGKEVVRLINLST